MPLTRDQITLDVGGGDEVTLECEPFNWPRNTWEVLEIKATRTVGWYALSGAAITALLALFNGAHGGVESGLTGLIVQCAPGTGHASFTVTDWRGNTGSFVFQPNDGLELDEIPGSAPTGSGDGYFTGTLKLILA
jgi:hypothetical protein